ncbi:MAG: LysM peptidoglycan-binding domain-containing protein [Bacteroidota bacterium]
MLRKIRYVNILASFFLFFGYQSFAQKSEPTAKEVITKMLKSIRDVERFKYSLKIIERGKKGLNYYESSVKLNRNPRKIYLYIKGIELLWVDGWNNNKAYIKPNSFPFFNLSLNPLGSLMRQDQHHNLNDMGFDYFGSIIGHMTKKLGDKFDAYFTLEGTERYNNRPCYKVIINNKDFGYDTYTVGENESITSIARKLHISEYMILEVNPKLNDYFDILKKGQKLKVPNAYAKYVTLYIDQLYFLPIGVKVLDDKGLYEQYDYFFLQVNPKIEDSEFTTSYGDYKF